MAKKTPKKIERVGVRFNMLRVDAHVGASEKKIARMLKLPEGSVKLVNPDKKPARPQKIIGALLRDWDKAL